MQIQKIIIGAVALGLVALTVYVTGIPKVITEREPLGAVSPEFATRYIRVGGLMHEYRYSNTLQVGTSTLCSFPVPAATSTLLSAGIRMNTATASALQIFIAKGTTPNATTTRLASANNAASALFTVMSTTTSDSFVITPSVTPYINFNVAGGPTKSGVDAVFAADGSVTGSCYAEFIAT